jgi:hypothetical protein
VRLFMQTGWSNWRDCGGCRFIREFRAGVDLIGPGLHTARAPIGRTAPHREELLPPFPLQLTYMKRAGSSVGLPINFHVRLLKDGVTRFKL